MTHAFAPRHLTENSVGNELAFRTTESVKKNEYPLQIGSKRGSRSTTLVLVHLGTGLDAAGPRNRYPERNPLKQRALEERRGGTDVLLV